MSRCLIQAGPIPFHLSIGLEHGSAPTLIVDRRALSNLTLSPGSVCTSNRQMLRLELSCPIWVLLTEVSASDLVLTTLDLRTLESRGAMEDLV